MTTYIGVKQVTVPELEDAWIKIDDSETVRAVEYKLTTGGKHRLTAIYNTDIKPKRYRVPGETRTLSIDESTGLPVSQPSGYSLGFE